jgi:hypothetical protein
MVLYRLCGRAEAFKDCGMVMIPPMVDSSLTRIRKESQVLIRTARKAKLVFKVKLQKLTIKKIGQDEVIQFLTDEDPTSLIAEIEQIGEWKS